MYYIQSIKLKRWPRRKNKLRMLMQRKRQIDYMLIVLKLSWLYYNKNEFRLKKLKFKFEYKINL